MLYFELEEYILDKIKNVITFEDSELWKFRLFMLVCFIICLILLSFILANPLLLTLIVVSVLLLLFRYNFNKSKNDDSESES